MNKQKIGGFLFSSFLMAITFTIVFSITGLDEILDVKITDLYPIYSFFVVEHFEEHRSDVTSFTDGYTLIHRDSEGRMISYDDGDINLIMK